MTSTCCRELVLACFVGPALLVAPAVVVLLPAAFVALADRFPPAVLFAVLCDAVLVAFDEVDFA